MIRARDTDTFIHAFKGLKKKLIEQCSDPEMMRAVLEDPARVEAGPCILFSPAEGDRHIHYVERKTFAEGKEVLVSVRRAAFAVARQNRHDHLTCKDEALHSCGQTGNPDNGQDCCINPHHIYKGTEAERLGKTRANLKKPRANYTEDVLGTVRPALGCRVLG